MVTSCSSDQQVLVPEVQEASLEIISARHPDEVMGPRPHNSPPGPHFSPLTRKDEVLVNKVTCNGTLENSLPHGHVFSIDHDKLLMLRNSQLCNKCNWRPVVSHVLWWDIDRMAHNLLTEGAGRLLLPFFSSLYIERDAKFHSSFHLPRSKKELKDIPFTW